MNAVRRIVNGSSDEPSVSIASEHASPTTTGDAHCASPILSGSNTLEKQLAPEFPAIGGGGILDEGDLSRLRITSSGRYQIEVAEFPSTLLCDASRTGRGNGRHECLRDMVPSNSMRRFRAAF